MWQKSQEIHLIEPETADYFKHVLRQCHDNRVRIYQILLNVIIVICFVVFFAALLYMCRSKKLTPYEKYKKMMRDQEYVLSKIREYQIQKMRQHESLTNLPDSFAPSFPSVF